MLTKIINEHTFCLEWDWKSAPDVGQIQTCTNFILSKNKPPKFYEYDTGSDQHGMIITSKNLSDEDIELIQSYQRDFDPSVIDPEPFK